MAEEKLFHESWYRIAGQKLSLRPSVRAKRQMFRGTRWYVLRDPFSDQFYRLTAGAYRFVARLDGVRTVEEVWKEALERDPEGAPGQGDIVELFAQLYHANLLHYRLPPDSVKLFERYSEKKQRIFQATLMNIMFMRLPLFDPDPLLKRLERLIKVIFGPVGLAVWVVAALAGLKVAVEHFSELKIQSEGVLAPSNLFLLYLGTVLIKTLHEFGHASAVRRFGGEVHTMGVMFLIFSPLPYMDASAAWSFRNKWHRVLVGAAGMIFEIFLACLMALVWAHTGEGVLHSLAYNMMFVASVSTLVFNINPLLRYDGYYILSDLVDVPNLHQRATDQMTALVERHAFGCKDANPPAATTKEAVWLCVFGVASGLYRVVVFSAMLFFIADKFLLLGLIMALVCAVSWVVTPVVGLVRYLASSQRLHRTRSRAVAVTAGAFAAAFLFLAVIPFPCRFKAPGVLKAAEYVVAVNKAEGVVDEVLSPSGKQVEVGTPLLRLKNPELELKLRETRAGLDEARAQFQKAMQNQQADMAPMASRMDYFEKRLGRLEQDSRDLVVKAEVKGVWVSPRLQDYPGMWMARGTALGQIVNGDKFNFVSVVHEEDVSPLFSGKVKGAQVKLAGQAETSIKVIRFTSIPMEQNQLPSAALGWSAGGDVAIDVSDNHGVKTAEPFYEVRAEVDPKTRAALFHGLSGKIRFRLAAEPLLEQGWRGLRQIVQKRYHV